MKAKALIKSILVVAMMLGTYTSYANETLRTSPTFKFINEGDNISITNAYGEVIYQGRINYNGNLLRLFNFSQLNNGTYTIEIIKDFMIEIVDLKVKNKKVTLIKNSQEKIFKPVFRTENNILIISKIALDSKDMKVELYYEDELIYSERIEDKEDVLNRIYKLNETNRGDYKAIIRANDRVYIENFKI